MVGFSNKNRVRKSLLSNSPQSIKMILTKITSQLTKENLSIILYIQKFQSVLINQKFLFCIDCKSEKEVLQNDVQNLALKILKLNLLYETQTQYPIS